MVMATARKTRTLHLADGGQFRIGPGTVSVPVPTLPLDPPAVVLHINRSCGALELEPDEHGMTPPPMRVDPARVLELVQQINADRAMAAMRGGAAVPPVELPPNVVGQTLHRSMCARVFRPAAVGLRAVGGHAATTCGGVVARQRVPGHTRHVAPAGTNWGHR